MVLMLALNSSGQNPPAAQTHQQPSPSPTPDKGKEFFRKMREEQERDLNQHGPQPSASSQTGGYSMLAFIRAGWPLVVEYEIESEAVAELDLVTLNDRGFHIFKHRLEGIDIGDEVTLSDGPQQAVRLRYRKDIVRVPAEFGDLQPGTIGFSARMKTTTGSRKARFRVLLLGVGVSTGVSSERRPHERRETESLSFSLIKSNFGMSLPLPDSALRNVDISPEVIDTSLGEKAAYSFIPAENFAYWAADFNAVTYGIKDGIEVTKTKRIFTKEFNNEINGGSQAQGDWDGRNARGKFSRGPHQLAIRAWWSAGSVGDGKSCVRNADKLITVQ